MNLPTHAKGLAVITNIARPVAHAQDRAEEKYNSLSGLSQPTPSERRRQNVLMWACVATLPICAAVGLFVGNDWIAFTP